MAEVQEFKFPDELEQDNTVDITLEQDTDDITVEIVDDTPKEDRNRKPLESEVKDQLETLDESEDYSKNVKEKFSQYKKAWHEERRAKEAALREQQEALKAAQAILDENKRLQEMLKSGEKELNSNYKSAAKAELEKAKKDYKDAYDSGDADKLLEAQENMVKAQLKLDKAKKFKNSVQNDQNSVKIQSQQYQPQVQPQMDPKVAQWVSRNQWFVDPNKKRMRTYAEAYHEELQNMYGMGFIGTDEYYNRIDSEMKARFPEEFGEAAKNDEEKPQRTQKLSTVVAPVKRSTAPKKIVLTKSAQAIAKKLGITPEQYAREFIKLEA
jgi:DNA repair exonuclease SbcCD ATPase subunit